MKENKNIRQRSKIKPPVLIRDHYQNFKGYHIPRAQLVIADIPYNIGINAYGSNPQWYIDGDNSNGQSELAGKKFFPTDDHFNSNEFMHFCSKLMVKEPKERGKAPCMIVFCSFEQQWGLIELARKHGIMNYINLIFRKNFSPQVLKANMRVVGNSEYALLLYRDKLPKFNNNGKMIFNIMDWEKDSHTDPLFTKIHPTQKPIKLLEKLINIFTDPGDVVLDPVAGSGSTLISAYNLGRRSWGFEIDKNIYNQANEWIDRYVRVQDDIKNNGFSVELMESETKQQSLFNKQAEILSAAS